MQSVCPRFVDSQDSGPHDPHGGDGKLLPTARGDELVPALPTAPWLHKASSLKNHHHSGCRER